MCSCRRKLLFPLPFLLAFLAFLTFTVAEPFQEPHSLLFPRACPSNYLSCATIGYPAACCPPSSVCQFDDSGAIACCEFRATCSGSLNRNQGTCATGMFACGNEYPGGCCRDGERCGAGECLPMQSLNGTAVVETSGSVGNFGEWKDLRSVVFGGAMAVGMGWVVGGAV